MTRALAHARFTQPILRLFLHIYTFSSQNQNFASVSHHCTCLSLSENEDGCGGEPSSHHFQAERPERVNEREKRERENLGLVWQRRHLKIIANGAEGGNVGGQCNDVPPQRGQRLSQQNRYGLRRSAWKWTSLAFFIVPQSWAAIQ